MDSLIDTLGFFQYFRLIDWFFEYFLLNLKYLITINFRADFIDIKINLLVHTVLKKYETTGLKTGNRNGKQKFPFPVSEPVELHIVWTALTSRSILVFLMSAQKLIV